jgi:hypothetical protein
MRFAAGKMGDSRDFIKWAGLFIRYQHLKGIASAEQTTRE